MNDPVERYSPVGAVLETCIGSPLPVKIMLHFWSSMVKSTIEIFHFTITKRSFTGSFLTIY